MDILVFILVVLILVALGLYAVDLLPIGDAVIKALVKVLVVVIGLVAIAHRAGVF